MLIDWNDKASQVIIKRWLEFQRDLENLNELRIPRWIQYTPEANIEIHGFADASLVAYAACVYLRINKIMNQPTTSVRIQHEPRKHHRSTHHHAGKKIQATIDRMMKLTPSQRRHMGDVPYESTIVSAHTAFRFHMGGLIKTQNAPEIETIHWLLNGKCAYLGMFNNYMQIGSMMNMINNKTNTEFSLNPTLRS